MNQVYSRNDLCHDDRTINIVPGIVIIIIFIFLYPWGKDPRGYKQSYTKIY